MKRNKFGGETKLRAVLKLLNGKDNAVETARAAGCHPTLLKKWKERFLIEAPKIFETPKETDEKEKRIEELERIIGKLTVQNEFLKKASGSFN